MPLILNIETSGTVCSICLADNGKLIDFREDKQGNSHARVLTVFIDELFKKNDLPFNALSAVAISSGPGSYTGLRIGTSVAKGLCYALEKPLIAVPTLLSLARAIGKKAGDSSAFYMPVIDARRMDIYTAVFDAAGSEVIKTARVTVEKQLEDMISALGKVFIAGNAVNKCRDIFTAGRFHYAEGVECDSRSMMDISDLKFKNSEFEDLAYFEPAYTSGFSPKNNG